MDCGLAGRGRAPCPPGAQALRRRSVQIAVSRPLQRLARCCATRVCFISGDRVVVVVVVVVTGGATVEAAMSSRRSDLDGDIPVS